ncbi:MAG: FIST C-terminal domain-containing protein, partial [Candidatus Dormibacteraeota bacterium]|nr:FIST C-terminal domain-containing protein [Candidatus Dormibacteraeota bacterium]
MNNTTRTRWLGVGESGDPDATRAGRQAAEAALTGPDPKLLVVFAADGYDLTVLARAVKETAGDTPVIGCSTAGEIATGGAGNTGVVVTALGGSGFAVATALAEATTGRLREASSEAAMAMERVGKLGHEVLMILTDGLAGDQQEVVRGAYDVVGASVPLVGGCAGDDLKMRRTHQIFDGRVVTGGIVAAAISSTAPLGIGVSHGWRKVGAPMLVTKSSDNRVFELDDRPALDVYLERLQVPEDARQDADAFTRFAITHPLGLSRRSGEEVRFVGGADFATRSLSCIAEVPQGGLAWFMEGDTDSVLEATDNACAQALHVLGDAPPIGLIAFDCI